MYCSPNIVRVIKSRKMRWAGHVARMGERRGVYRVLVWKPDGTRLLGRPRRKIYRTIVLPVVLFGCETWSLTLKEERRLMVFYNRVLRENIWA